MTFRVPSRLDPSTLLKTAPFVVLILLAAGLSYRYHVLLRDQRDRVDHTYQVIGQLQTAFVSMIDAETGQRGYLLTGDERYLAPYRSAVADVPASLASLRRRVEDSPAQVRRVDALGRLVQEKFDELRSSVAARQTRGFDAARSIVIDDRGRVAMDALRDVIGTMERDELALLDERAAEARGTERRLLLSTIVCAALSLVARIGMAIATRRAAA